MMMGRPGAGPAHRRFQGPGLARNQPVPAGAGRCGTDDGTGRDRTVAGMWIVVAVAVLITACYIRRVRAATLRDAMGSMITSRCDAASTARARAVHNASMALRADGHHDAVNSAVTAANKVLAERCTVTELLLSDAIDELGAVAGTHDAFAPVAAADASYRAVKTVAAAYPHPDLAVTARAELAASRAAQRVEDDDMGTAAP